MKEKEMSLNLCVTCGFDYTYSLKILLLPLKLCTCACLGKKRYGSENSKRSYVKTQPGYPIVSCRGRVCPNTQSKLLSGGRTSPLRTKRQHYPRFDTTPFLYFVSGDIY